MASGALGNLTVDLLLETAQWAQGLTKAEYQAEKFADEIEKKFNKMTGKVGDALKGAVAGLVAGLAVDRIAGFVNETQKLADTFDELAQKTGTGTAFIAEVSVLAGTAGTNIEALASSFGKFNKATTEAFADKESKPAKVFEALGVSVVDTAGKLKSSEALYKEAALAMGALEDSAVKSAAAQVLWGKAGADSIPMFNAMARASDELNAATKSYGEEMARLAPIAGALEEQQAIMQTNSRTYAAILGQQLVPYMTELVKQWNDATTSGSALATIGTALMNAFKGIVIAIDAVLTTFSNLISLVVGGVKIFERLKAGDLTGAGREYDAMMKEVAQSSADFEKRLRALLDPMATVTAEAEKGAKASDKLAKAVGGAGNEAEKNAKAWKEFSKAWVDAIDDQIKAEKEAALASAKAAQDRADAYEKAAKEIHANMMQALNAEQQIQREADEATQRYYAQMGEKRAAELEAQWGGMFKGIESAGRAAFDTMFDSTADGWEGLMDGMKNAFKRILMDYVYQAFAKPFVMQLAAGMPGGLGQYASSQAGATNGIDLSSLVSGGRSVYEYFFGGGAEQLSGPGMSSGGGILGIGGSEWYNSASGGWASAGAGVAGGLFGAGVANWYGAGERGQANATNYAGTGAAIGMQVYGPIGAAVGAIIGTIVGISTDPDPDAMRTAVFGTTQGAEGLTSWTGESAFGSFGFSSGEWLSEADMGETMTAFLRGIETMDNALAGFMTDEQVARVTTNLAEFSRRYELGMEHQGVASLGQLLKDRLAIITAEFSDGLHDFVVAFEGDADDLVTIVAAYMDASRSGSGFNVDEVLESLKPKGMMESYQTMRGDLEAYIATMDTSAESMSGLVARMGDFQVATIEMVAALDNVAAAMHDMFMSTADSIRMSVMAPEQQYAYLQAQTDALFEQLMTSTDPNEIAALAEQMNSNINAAWGLLNEEQRQALASQYLDRLEGLDATVAERMQALREVVIEDADGVMQSITDRLDALFAAATEAANTQQDAANTNLEAAQTPVTVVVIGGDSIVTESGGGG